MADTNGSAAPANAATSSNNNPDPQAEPSDADLMKILAGETPADARSPEDDDDGDDAGHDEDIDGEGGEEEDLDAETGDNEDDDGDDAAAGDAEDTDDDEGDQPDQPDSDDDADIKAIRGKFTPDQQRLFDKAISKKARRIIDLRTQNEQLQQSLQQRETELEQERAKAATPAAPTAENPLLDTDDETAIDNRVAQAKAMRAWARKHPQGGFIKDGDNEIEITAERAAELLDQAEDLINEHAPKRRQFLRERAAAEAEGEKMYPWLKDKKSPGALTIAQWMREIPALRSLPIPGLRLALADMLVGAQHRINIARKNADGATAAGKKPGTPAKAAAPKAAAGPAGAARPPKVAAGAKAAAGAGKKLEQTGDDPDNAALRALLKS